MILEMIAHESGLPPEFYQRFPNLSETESSICYAIYRAQITTLSDDDRRFLDRQKPLIIDYQTIDFQTYEQPVAHQS